MCDQPLQRPFRSIASTLLLASIAWTSSSYAADWTATAFPIKNHDFGTCAVAAKTEFRFPVFNSFGQPMHITAVRASCGCTTPTVETPVIQPGQSGTIHARFNTDTFRGKKGATLTVVISRPFYAEVRLRVDGYIRSDMVFHPGAVDFGTINQGEPISKAAKVLYAGRSDWQITGVRSNKPWLIPTLKETSRGGGRANYEIQVGVTEDAPKGYFQDQVVVVTNDRSMPQVPLRVTGNVESALTISPQAIALGTLKPGEAISKRLVIKGRQPFTIQSIQATGWDVTFDKSDVARTTHLVMANFTPTEAVGQQNVSLRITTGGESSVSADATLTAMVRDR
ncbi:MAG: DUF1573 domain-containing protein [Pirellulaceae bacterium]|nr:DUF1573 domain-containing protein [Pirellulaceae bacterium]